MAEARQAVAFQFAVTEEGVQVHFDRRAVKSAVKALVSSSKSRYMRASNAVLNQSGIFPASPLSLCLVSGVAGCSVLIGRDFSFGLNKLILSLLQRCGLHGNYVLYVVLGCEVVFGCVALSYLQRYLLKGLLRYHGWMFDPHGKRSLSTKVWGGAVRTVTSLTRPGLFSYQSSLPTLPVPALKDTCTRYLESVRPLMDDPSYEEMQQLVQDFQNGPGKKIQRYLVLKSWWSSNYVTDWWESFVYLHGRSSIMINSNYYACDNVGSFDLTTNPVARAAQTSHILIRLKGQVERGSLKPLLVMGMVPLCSAQYERLFGTTRVPGVGADQLRHYSGAQSDYCVCYKAGKWFKVPLTTPLGRPYSPAELEHLYQMVWDAAEEGEAGPGEELLSALTTLGRDEWAEAREMYFQEGVNKVSMETIEKAAYVLYFDEKSPGISNEDAGPSSFTTYCKDLLHGDGHTRWFDKSITVVIYANGRLGINAEHSWADAPIVGYLMEYACNMQYTLGYQDGGHTKRYGALPKPSLSPPIRLQWQLPPACVARINSAHSLAVEQITDLDMYVLRHDEFGKGAIKQCKVSPDAFIQMALQMAYYKDAGKFCLTYEASMTRLYLHGRTETVRPVSKYSTLFVKAMCDPALKDTYTVEQKRQMLVEATDYHAYSYKLAMTGQGIDRHLFCLYVMSKYLKMESPFLSKVLHEPWRLSTSQTPSQQTGIVDFDSNPERVSGGGGFGPVTKDGYGVSYIIQGDNVIFFHVSAFKSAPDTDACRFAGLIKESLREIKDLFQLS